MIRTLRFKFICVTMAIFTVFLAVLLCLLVHTTAEGLRTESIAHLRQSAEGPIGPDRPGQLSLPCFVIRMTPMGQLVQPGSFDLTDEEMLSDIISRAAASQSEIGEIPEYSLRFCRQERPGELTMAFMDITGEISTLKTLQLNCICLGIISSLVFWLLSTLLARWAVRPVEQAWQEQRQFVADASHELKTPLTVIMTNAELLQCPADEDRQSQYARSILTMSQRMRSLVEGLLDLARVDNGAVRSAFEVLDLSELVSDELLTFEPVCFERGLALESEIAEGIRVSGSRQHLRQVLDILLDNAMKYSPSGSTIHVQLNRQGCHAQLTVTNPGEAMTREQCQQIFRRFYRVDAARTCGGYGLGLPIAKGIVTDHGGKIHAESRDGLVTLRIQFPFK